MSENGTLPDFFIVGAAKAGTTSLYHYLSQHPALFLSRVKEPGYFALEGGTVGFAGPGDRRVLEAGATENGRVYRELFRGAEGRVAGEASTLYLSTPGTAARIAEVAPNARIIVLLREPSERAFSAYAHLVRDGWEELDFEAALEAEPQRRAAGWYPSWHYAERGHYGRQLREFDAAFGPERVGVWFHEDLRHAAPRVCHDIFGFLGVDQDVRVDVSVLHNASGAPRSRSLQRILSTEGVHRRVLRRLPLGQWPHRLLGRVARANLRPLELRDATRRALSRRFEDDVRAMEARTGRDLSSWRGA